MLQALLDNGILLLFLVIFVVLVVFGFVGTYFQDKEEKLYDERMRLLQGRAWRDTYYLLVAMGVLVMFVCYFFSAVWSGLRKEAGLPEAATAPAMLCLITMTGISFYMANCIVRDIALAKEKSNKELFRVFGGALLLNIMINADAVRDVVWRDNAAEPADWFLLLRFGFFIFFAFQLIALIIRLYLDRKEASEEG